MRWEENEEIVEVEEMFESHIQTNSNSGTSNYVVKKSFVLESLQNNK